MVFICFNLSQDYKFIYTINFQDHALKCTIYFYSKFVIVSFIFLTFGSMDFESRHTTPNLILINFKRFKFDF